jgi:hypothetical protein
MEKEPNNRREMTHEEKTRLIAEFDGWEFVPSHKDYPNGCFVIDSPSTIFPNEPRTHEDFGYSTEYDCLMPVWHKFRGLRIESVKDQFIKSEKNENIRFALINGNIEGLFNALAEAIEWYNTTKK